MNVLGQKKCHRCGYSLVELREGRPVYLRCLCEWDRAFRARVSETLLPDFYTRTMRDWNPPLFAAGGYRAFMEAQLAMVPIRVFRYAFKDDAIKANVRARRNLFVRGPAGSGRGLLAACVKRHAIFSELSVTRLPNDYDILKNELAESDVFGSVGEGAKVALNGKYESPDLMVVEHARAEQKFKPNHGEERTRKIKGFAALDALLARRVQGAGCMMVTSSDFLGQIAESMGDRMLEELSSPRTDMILMLSPKETLDLDNEINARRKWFVEFVMAFGGGTKIADEGKSRLEKNADMGEVETFRQALYFEAAFPVVVEREGIDNMKIKKLVESGIDKWERAGEALPVWTRFCEARETGSAEFEEGVAGAQMTVVEACRSLAEKLSQREKEEVGKMLGKAASVNPDDPGDEILASWREQAEKHRRIMSGEENG
jgi:hypothetical protein